MSIARVRGPGHPDQACDLVAASIVEEYVRRDPTSRLNIRVSGGRGVLFAVGEVFSRADFDVSAVVRRALGSVGTASLEPFIAFEPMLPGWAPEFGAREPVTVVGYATADTQDRLPKPVSMARDIARELERRRTSDPDWFWLGTDFDVSVQDVGRVPLIIIRAEHVDEREPNAVREAITSLLETRTNGADIRVNPSGKETEAGLASRIGSSGSTSSSDLYGSALPSHASGVGLHPSHPLNLGSAFARAAARELVAAGKGKAILAQLTWMPMESRPHVVRIRNERGEDVSAALDLTRFDLAKPPPAYLAPGICVATLRQAFEATSALPWES